MIHSSNQSSCKRYDDISLVDCVAYLNDVRSPENKQQLVLLCSAIHQARRSRAFNHKATQIITPVPRLVVVLYTTHSLNYLRFSSCTVGGPTKTVDRLKDMLSPRNNEQWLVTQRTTNKRHRIERSLKPSAHKNYYANMNV